MKQNLRLRPARYLALSLAGVALSFGLARGQEKAIVQTGGTVHVIVAPGAAPPPPVSITLHERHGHVTPYKGMCTHTGGGLIDIASPAPDTVVITMTGVVVANADMRFDLDQTIEVSFDDPKVKRAKLTVEGRVIGLLRGGIKGTSSYSDACANIVCGTVNMLSVCVPPHSVCGRENLSVNDHDGPKWVPVTPGKYTLNQTFAVSAHTDNYVCKRPSAEFAPDPALDPIWISYHEPFHGVKKDTFGFQVILKVAPDTESVAAELIPTPMEKKAPPAKYVR